MILTTARNAAARPDGLLSFRLPDRLHVYCVPLRASRQFREGLHGCGLYIRVVCAASLFDHDVRVIGSEQGSF